MVRKWTVIFFLFIAGIFIAASYDRFSAYQVDKSHDASIATLKAQSTELVSGGVQLKLDIAEIRANQRKTQDMIQRNTNINVKQNESDAKRIAEDSRPWYSK